MTDLLEVIYLVLFQPRQALRRLAGGVPWWWSLSVFCGVYLFGQGLDLATGREWAASLAPLLSSTADALVRSIVILGMPAALLVWFLETAVWHLLAQFFGGRGQGTVLFLALGFTNLPMVVGQGLAAVLRLAGHGAFQAVFLPLAAIWVCVLQVMAVKEVHALSGGKAVAVVVLPFVVVLAVLIMGAAVLWV